jgi:hypothetical protein
MNDDVLNILSENHKEFDSQKMLDYLAGKLSPEEKHAFEQSLIDSEMMNDAVEGLEKLNREELPATVKQLNSQLRKQLGKKKLKKAKRGIKDIAWLYISIVLVLLLIVIGFIVIKKRLESSKESVTSYRVVPKATRNISAWMYTSNSATRLPTA